MTEYGFQFESNKESHTKLKDTRYTKHRIVQENNIYVSSE